MKELSSWLRASVTGKLFFIGLLVLVLLIPLGMIESQIAERGFRADEAAQQVASTWGADQTIGGPALLLPYEDDDPMAGETIRFKDEVYTLPTRLQVDIVVETEILQRGIYEIPVYTATVDVAGSFSPLPAADDNAGIVWNDALLSLPVTDARSIREPVTITIGDTTAEFGSGGERIPGLGSQLVVSLSELEIGSFDQEIDFTMSYRIGGTAKLMVLPFGDVTTVTLRADWPSPSFGGHFLPGTRNVGDDGFDASWTVLSLGRGYPSSWHGSDTVAPTLAQRIPASAFGVDLIVPVGVHQASLRATKYAVLFLSLTFLAYFLFELFTPLRLHALQYLLVGLANSIFYLLLIAIAEHVGFVIAYVTSAVASTGLIGTYSAAVLGSARRAVPITLLLSAIYGYLYFVLQLEDYALLSGSFGLLVMLAGVMYATRHVDWYAIDLTSATHRQIDLR